MDCVVDSGQGATFIVKTAVCQFRWLCTEFFEGVIQSRRRGNVKNKPRGICVTPTAFEINR
jgi:hypothetical protein